jgi:hypothetical protein
MDFFDDVSGKHIIPAILLQTISDIDIELEPIEKEERS